MWPGVQQNTVWDPTNDNAVRSSSRTEYAMPTGYLYSHYSMPECNTKSLGKQEIASSC